MFNQKIFNNKFILYWATSLFSCLAQRLYNFDARLNQNNFLRMRQILENGL
jgi:hypothetical protein